MAGSMQGYLKKKSPRTQGKKIVDIWQKRYFVLADHQLKYYKTEKDAASSSADPLKMIALASVHCAAPNPKHADMFVIDLGAERKVKLQAASEEDRDAWVAALEQSKVEAWSKQETDAYKDVASRVPGTPGPPTGGAAETNPASPPVNTPSGGGTGQGVEKKDLLGGGESKPACCIIS